MKKSISPLALLIFAIVGCQNSSKEAKQGLAGDPNATRRASALPRGAKELVPVNDATGNLVPASEFDAADLQKNDKLPYEVESGSAIVDPKVPEQTIELNGKPVAYSKDSNEVIRAIRAVPPKEAITGIKTFKLKLTDVVVYLPKGTQKPMAGQSLCLVDGGGACLGEKPTEGARLSPHDRFWNGVKVSGGDVLPYPADFSAPVAAGNEGDQVAIRPGILEIDLLDRFQLDSRSAVDFVMSHSVQYSSDKSGKFRKFRMVLGNRIFVSGGSLELEFDLDPTKLPEGWEKISATPLNGANDTIRIVRESKDPEGRGGATGGETIKNDSELKYELDSSVWLKNDGSGELSDAGKTKALNLAATLGSRGDQVKEVVITVTPGDAPFAEKLKAELIENQVSPDLIRLKTDAESGACPSLRVELLRASGGSGEGASSEAIDQEVRSALQLSS